MTATPDLDVRLAAFEWLSDRRERIGEVFDREELRSGFTFRGQRVPLMSPQQGIWKPAFCELPISITTTLNGPYRDSFDDSRGVIRYSYQGDDPGRWDNVGLRRAMATQAPLVYFHPVARPGRYLATFPVFIVGDDQPGLMFSVQLDAPTILERLDVDLVAEDRGATRAYYTSTVRRRAHQASFRERVLIAYREMCALCRLRHGELLDAAHIVADNDPEGEPLVTNGLALCKLHHAAFDSFFLTVTPEYRVVVRPSILAETDGPMLVVGLQQLHGQPIELPRAAALRPDQAKLARRLERFRIAS
ncbi:MAG TPA: HNH endonuclease [Candidatus Limnocylindrales bacterium]|nr:HNH endonuclease [Candidatus Limnocylindrales bacterium]